MKRWISDLKDLIFGKEMGIIPAGLAFSFFLAMIPILSLVFFILTSFNVSLDMIQNLLSEAFPVGVVNLLQPVLTDKITVDSLITLIFGCVVATNGIGAIIIASNTIFHIENAPFIKRIIKSFILTIFMILLFSFIVVVPLLGSSILSLFGTVGTFISENEVLVNIIYIALQVPISLLVIFFFIKIVYTIAPDERVSSRYVTKGAIFTTISWLVVTGVYSYYINNIARYDLVYGNLANIVILLLWFYIMAYIFVIGIFLNRKSAEVGIEQTNTIKLDAIKEKVKENNMKNNVNN